MTTNTTYPVSIPVTEKLAGFASALEWDAVPADLRELMPVLLVDYFRAAAAGYAQPWSCKARALYAGSVGPRQAAVLYSGEQVDAMHAAFINGTTAGGLDWDDSHVAAIIHPGVVVWPAAIAMAQAVGASGRELLTAAVAGYETAIRVGMAIQPEHSLRGFQGTPACGVFGAAAACGRLLRFDARKMRDTLGIAATFACGLSQFFVSGSDIKRFHAGKAAANGMEAATLAEAGFTGPHDAIEGVQGFAHAFSDRFDPATSVHALGHEFPTSWVSLKPHAGSVRMQSAIEAAIVLARGGVLAEDIRAIELGVHGAMIGKLTSTDPVDQQQAQLSTPFAAALSLVLAPQRPGTLVLSVDDFKNHLHHPLARSLSARTTVVADAEVEKLTTREAVPARVTITLNDGSTREHFLRFPKGSPQNPIGRDEVCERFRALAGDMFTSHMVEAWLTNAVDAESLADISPLLALRAA